MDPRDRPYYWIGGYAPTGVPERGTDIGALSDGFISITPLQLDLTAYRVMTDLNSWEWQEQTQKKLFQRLALLLPG
jgi:Predicted acid phosphatase